MSEASQCENLSPAHQDQPNRSGVEEEEEDDEEFLPGFASLEDYSKVSTFL